MQTAKYSLNWKRRYAAMMPPVTRIARPRPSASRTCLGRQTPTPGQMTKPDNTANPNVQISAPLSDPEGSTSPDGRYAQRGQAGSLQGSGLGAMA